MDRSDSEIVDQAFVIQTNFALKMIVITMKGFWESADFERFNTKLRALLAVLQGQGWIIGKQVTLFDASEYSVQGQDVTAGLAGMASDISIGSRKIAIVLSAGLLKLQARRVAPEYRIFDNRESAIAWLTSDDANDSA